ncbi:hypothetical protein GCM10010168_21810 [Actinoplanes ianthinogenes]|uniref:Secreted protein n=1 Tax=Actinoplanes ianthinogenes TaxID=122358 RepID=A0ABN6CTY6_9ACTN|nr:hypothetical protein Aiant_84790 [Actinoplanes ianthinogenes]GGR04405.1 hypothetical protein GCM10010168_21810 [Actinoplanes ianthinogenes]
MEVRVQVALLAALSGLIGIIVGRFWDARSESRRWRRDQRMQSYQAVAGEFYRYRDAIRELGCVTRPGPEHDERLAEVSKLRTDWNRSLATLWLHGSERAAACALSVDHQLSKLSTRAREESIPHEQWLAEREPVLTAYDDFVDAIRSDLSLSPLAALRAGAGRRSLGSPASTRTASLETED